MKAMNDPIEGLESVSAKTGQIGAMPSKRCMKDVKAVV